MPGRVCLPCAPVAGGCKCTMRHTTAGATRPGPAQGSNRASVNCQGAHPLRQPALLAQPVSGCRYPPTPHVRTTSSASRGRGPAQWSPHRRHEAAPPSQETRRGHGRGGAVRGPVAARVQTGPVWRPVRHGQEQRVAAPVAVLRCRRTLQPGAWPWGPCGGGAGATGPQLPLLGNGDAPSLPAAGCRACLRMCPSRVCALVTLRWWPARAVRPIPLPRTARVCIAPPQLLSFPLSSSAYFPWRFQPSVYWLSEFLDSTSLSHHITTA